MPESQGKFADAELQRSCNILGLLAALVFGIVIFLFVDPDISAGFVIAGAGLVGVIGGQLAYHGIRHQRRKANAKAP